MVELTGIIFIHIYRQTTDAFAAHLLSLESFIVTETDIFSIEGHTYAIIVYGYVTCLDLIGLIA